MIHVRFCIPAYDRAFAEFVALVLKGVLAQDPILNETAGGPTFHGGPRRNVRGPQPLDHPMMPVHQEFTISAEVIRLSDTGAYADLLHKAAEEHRDRLLTSLFQQLSEVIDATG